MVEVSFCFVSPLLLGVWFELGEGCRVGPEKLEDFGNVVACRAKS